jgi:polysaccharide deacetylase 2 family uncharacterized protein YibQ
MPRDELRQPLIRRSLAQRLWSKRPSALAMAWIMSVSILAGGGYRLSRIPHPFAGEPIVVAAIPPVQEMKKPVAEKTEPASEEDQASDEATASTDPIITEDNQPVIYKKPTGNDEAVIIVSQRRPLRAAPIDAVTEAGASGPLPRVSNGKKPSDVYAQTVPMQVLASDKPKIAILIGGMGLNPKLTQKAIKDLPGDISFGFAPYGNDLQKQVNAARADGHEVMLQLPLEPVGYPASNPGPKTLLADASREENLDSLRWHMSRFAGYIGITNYMGSRFLATPDALQPVLAEMRERGLVFLEDGGPGLSEAAMTASATGLKMSRADVVIDASMDAAGISAQLDRLEEIARTNGMAIGTGSGLEITIDMLSQWAEGLQDKGIILVPVSATFRGRMG